MPTPAERVKGKADYGTTNIRNPQYGHWQHYVGVEHRCLVPVTSFAEPSPTPGDKDAGTGIEKNYWFAINEDRPLFFFAGLWTAWHGVRKVKDGPGDFELYGFMTTAPKVLIKPIHEKGNAGYPENPGGNANLADGAVVGGQEATAHRAGRCAGDRRQARYPDQIPAAGTSTRIIVLGVSPWTTS